MAANVHPRKKARLSEKKRRIILAIISTETQKQAAKKAGCSERTIGRLLRDMDFRREVDRAEGLIFDSGLRYLKARTLRYVKRFDVMVRDPSTPAYVVLPNIVKMFDFLNRHVERKLIENEINERLDSIERRLS